MIRKSFTKLKRIIFSELVMSLCTFVFNPTTPANAAMVQESEPNDDWTTADNLSLNTWVKGTMRRKADDRYYRDKDYYKFTISQAGETFIEKRTLIPAEAISKFRELTAARMSAIGQQLFQMKKIPGKRGIDYSREDVEKIFIYLRGEIDKCESEFIKKFDEKKADKFKVTKNPRTPAQPESLYLGYPRI